MEQMTAGMTSYFLSISRVQTSTSPMPASDPAPAPLGPSPDGSAIVGLCQTTRGRGWRRRWTRKDMMNLKFTTRVQMTTVLSEVHLRIVPVR